MHRRASRTRAPRSDERYQLIKQLGAGGMGIVYEATDRRAHRRVALKIARGGRAGHAAAVEQLEREAIAMVLAKDARICTVYRLDEHDGRACLVMERLVGQTLQARIASGAIGNRELLDLATQIAGALEAVHRVGLVHQDVKPANIFVTTTGSIKLLDFGLAMWSGAPQSNQPGHRTVRRSLLGTTNYIAPERILQQPVDPRSDLFSLGAVVYEMATGRLPFAGSSPAEALFNVLDSDPPAIRELAAWRPPAIDRLVRRLLAKRPGRRYGSAADVRRALTDISMGQQARVHDLHVRRSFFMKGSSHVFNDHA